MSRLSRRPCVATKLRECFSLLLAGTVLAMLMLMGPFAGPLGLMTPAYAMPDTTITELENAGADMDGRRVDFVGEAVGDIINAGEGYVWVTLVDTDPRQEASGYASISVYMASTDAVLISNLGRYHVVGTMVEVSGVFHLACSEHEGLSDVHASTVIVLEAGGPTKQNVNVGMVVWGLLFAVVAGLLLFLFYRLRERLR